MLPSTPCVEDQNIDISLGLLTNDDFQMDNVGDNVQQQVEELLFSVDSVPLEWQAFFSNIDPNLIQFESAKMPYLDQGQRNNGSPVIPLSVQQAQLDSIDPVTISESEFVPDDVLQLSVQLAGGDDNVQTMTTLRPQLLAERLAPPLTSADTTDQTVPFRRHDSACSVTSYCSDVKKERCSVSEAESTTMTQSSSPFLPTTLPTTAQPCSRSGRRGRPCLDDVRFII